MRPQRRNRPAVAGGAIGLAIAVLGTSTGGSVNPARQFGPAALSGQTRFLWVYLLAPMAGAMLATWVSVGDEFRHSIGARLWRAHHINGLDFNVLGVYQFGSFDGKPINAFTTAIEAGYKLFNLPWAPRIAGSLQVSSGGSGPHASKLETFNPMFLVTIVGP